MASTSKSSAISKTLKLNQKYKNIKLIILVGLPGAGKSTFTQLLQTSAALKINSINQDELGKKACENMFLSSIKNHDLTVLDRTNLTKKGRQEWVKLSLLNSKTEILCVYLNKPVEECTFRANQRPNHPTIKFQKADRILASCQKMLEPPTADEKYFEIVELYDDEDVRKFLKNFDCQQIEPEEQINSKFVKFPRTQHLINLGSATRDDLLVKDTEIKSYFDHAVYDSLEITEKVDGAQLGFSIDPENFKIRVQNRSHYVNAKSHAQFKNLNLWLETFSADLYEILEDSNKILFGEWLYAQHSIAYTNLPNYFLIFDLFDKKLNKFYERKVIEEKLENLGSKLELVRLVYRFDQDSNENLIKNKEDLLKLVAQKSVYGDENMEGIYIKLNQHGFVKSRSKIVKENFIAGNQHWSKGILTRNKLADF